MKNVFFVTDPIYTQHLTGPLHPECPDRITAIIQALEKAGLKNESNTLQPRMATEEEILPCHSRSYLNLVKQEVGSLGAQDLRMLSTGDAIVSKKSLEIALLAAGGVLVGIDQVMNRQDAKTFCIVRPPGHHACIAAGMGFCIFNNIAIGARYAQKKYGISKVLIVDWDVHHGNGTQKIFYSDPSVFYFSTHEKGLYPFTGHIEEVGEGSGKGFNLNCPIYPGPSSRLEVIKAFETKLCKEMEKFRPELILISAGFDGHVNDPLGHFSLNDQDFYILTKIVLEISRKYANGRVVSALEGGYNLEALQTASIAHVKGFFD